MSVASSLPDVHKHRKANSRIWLRDVDSRGKSVDPRFIEVGYQKEDDFFRYRSDKLNDEAVVANLVEEAVYRASRADKKEPIRDVGGYLFRVFSNLADREIARALHMFSCEAEVLANLPCPHTEAAKHILDRIEFRETLDQMPPDMRWAFVRRKFGFEVQEIAKEMNISPDCLSTRMRRALKQTLERLLGNDVR
jgi:DNA-directed RNA polymerase specialized sigma24 family protein